MKPFKGGHSYACQCCGEESCWDCEIAREELDPEYAQENGIEEDEENGNKDR